MQQSLLILSSGGDAPGMNAAIRAAVRYGIHSGFKVFGSIQGYQGLIDQNIITMHNETVANCIQRGGTILKTARCDAFKQPEIQAQCRAYLQQQQITAIIVLGGNGSFQGAQTLSENTDIQVIGIPCTIDNDIPGTDYCIGFDTACNTALQAIDHIRDTALSHDRHFMVEVMGRASGFLAVEVGIAGGAEFIIIPEFPVTANEIVEKLQQKKRQKLASIIVNAEADQPGHSIELARKINEISGIEYQTCILGHTQRGGSPTVRDGRNATVMGAKAVQAILAGETKKMTAVLNNHITLVEMPNRETTTQFFHREDLLAMNAIVCGID